MPLFGEDKTEVTGYVARSEMRYTPQGRAVLEFAVPIDRSYKPQGATEYVKRTIWYSIIVWGKYAEMLNARIEKGVFVSVTGTLNANWDTGGPRVFQKNDGTHGAKFEIKADNVVVGPKRQPKNGAYNQQQSATQQSQFAGQRQTQYGNMNDAMMPPPDDDDIPF